MKAKKVKKSYIVIESWMIEELKLKGIEKDIYAVIYGYSKDNQGVFTGKLAYLQFWTQSTRMGVSKALKNLINKGYIVKKTIGYNRAAYQALDLDDIKALKIHDGGQSNTKTMDNSVIHDGKLSYPSMANSVIHDGKLSYTRTNNININNINTLDRKKDPDSLPDKPNIPSLEEVKAYAAEMDLNFNPVKFYEYYQEKKWIKKNGEPVKSWKLTMCRWSDTEVDPKEKAAEANSKNSFQQNEYDFEALERELRAN